MLTRRNFLHVLAVSGIAVSADPTLNSVLHAEMPPTVKRDKIHQSVSLWCYSGTRQKKKMSLEDFILYCKKLGLEGLDLMSTRDFPLMKKHGMVCTMTSCGDISHGFNDRENHEKCVRDVRYYIEATSEYGFPNVIVFSGNCAGKSREEGLDNCVEGLKKVVGYAEEKKVTLCMEYLNSKSHKDYMCDNTAWAVELVKRVGSERFKILYDIYHADMMGEDVVSDITNHHECFGHYHTGGYPGRHEIDQRQKRDYRSMMELIYKTGYQGYVAHEFTPADADGLESLTKAYEICNIGKES